VHHRASGQARVRLPDGDHYLGPHGSSESKDRYNDLIYKWRLQHSDDNRYTLSVDSLALAYLEHCEQHYQKDGKPTSEVCCVRAALRFVIGAAGRMRARDFGPLMLKAARQKMIDAGLARTTINMNVMRARRMFKWGVSEELIPATVLVGLQSLSGLRAGRTKAREPQPVEPVSLGAIDAIKPHVSPMVWGAVQLQLLTGMRSGEVLTMRACDINTTGAVWEYRPASHKTAHHGKSRIVFLGPKAQAVVKELLTPNLQARLFEGYTRDSYRRAISRACERVGIEHWFPHQLRHTAATVLRREAGIEVAKAVLGHSDLDTTAIYAEADEARARETMRRLG
jgi:integrase